MLIKNERIHKFSQLIFSSKTGLTPFLLYQIQPLKYTYYILNVNNLRLFFIKINNALHIYKACEKINIQNIIKEINKLHIEKHGNKYIQMIQPTLWCIAKVGSEISWDFQAKDGSCSNLCMQSTKNKGQIRCTKLLQVAGPEKMSGHKSQYRRSLSNN